MEGWCSSERGEKLDQSIKHRRAVVCLSQRMETWVVAGATIYGFSPPPFIHIIHNPSKQSINQSTTGSIQPNESQSNSTHFNTHHTPDYTPTTHPTTPWTPHPPPPPPPSAPPPPPPASPSPSPPASSSPPPSPSPPPSSSA